MKIGEMSSVYRVVFKNKYTKYSNGWQLNNRGYVVTPPMITGDTRVTGTPQSLRVQETQYNLFY